MKSFQIIAALAATLVVGVQADISTTVVPNACATTTAAADDIVTRSDIAATPCTAPALTVISHAPSGSASAGNGTTYMVGGTGALSTATGSSSSSTSTPVMVSGSERVIGSFSGALAAAAAGAVVYFA